MVSAHFFWRWPHHKNHISKPERSHHKILKNYGKTSCAYKKKEFNFKSSQSENWINPPGSPLHTKQAGERKSSPGQFRRCHILLFSSKSCKALTESLLIQSVHTVFFYGHLHCILKHQWFFFACNMHLLGCFFVYILLRVILYMIFFNYMGKKTLENTTYP